MKLEISFCNVCFVYTQTSEPAEEEEEEEGEELQTTILGPVATNPKSPSLPLSLSLSLFTESLNLSLLKAFASRVTSEMLADSRNCGQ